MTRKKQRISASGIALLAAVTIIILIFALQGTRTNTAKQWNLTQRFYELSNAQTNLCAIPDFIYSQNNSSYLQGSCCSLMNLSSYTVQVENLRNYSNIPLIPSDPYNISVSLAKTLLGYQNLTLTAAQQAIYDNATKITNPCCCRCWRWNAFVGLAKYLITRQGFGSEQVARIWELEDGCGGPLDSPGFQPVA